MPKPKPKSEEYYKLMLASEEEEYMIRLEKNARSLTKGELIEKIQKNVNCLLKQDLVNLYAIIDDMRQQKLRD